MFEDFKFMFERTYETRWDCVHNTDKVSLSFYEDEKAYYVGDECTFNRRFTSFDKAFHFFALCRRGGEE